MHSGNDQFSIIVSVKQNLIWYILFLTYHWFLAQVSFSDHNLSVVRPHNCCRSKLFKFSSPSPKLNQTLHKASLGEGDSIYWNEGPCPFPRGDKYQIVKIHWRNFKVFFLRTTGPISTKLGTEHPWVKGIKICLNE